MSTDAQLHANQHNAALSTGPRTADGKAASARNAVKHNLNGRFTLLASEDKELYAQLVLSFIRDLQPFGALEEALTETIADTHWRLNRIRAKEEAIFLEGGAQETAALAMLTRYEAHQYRILAKTLSELRLAQKTRKAAEQQMLIDAYERKNKAVYNPKRDSHCLRTVRIGFVLENSPMHRRFEELLAASEFENHAQWTENDPESCASCEHTLPEAA